MVMIRCPDCGQHVLDVASSCPKCHRVLIQNPLETHGWGNLRVCGRCGKHIPRDIQVCPFCGHHVRLLRRIRLTAAAVGALVLAVGVVGVAWRAGILHLPARPESPAPRSAVAPVEPATEPVAAPLVVAAPDTTGARSTDTTRAAAATRTTPPPALLPRPVGTPPASPAQDTPGERVPFLVTRWTVDWANIREDRSIESRQVRVLAPGIPIEVGNIRGGWWAVWENGHRLGYVANSVLTTEPPPR